MRARARAAGWLLLGAVAASWLGGAAAAAGRGDEASLCAAVVAAAGCDADLRALGSERTVREACPGHCAGGVQEAVGPVGARLARRLAVAPAQNCSASATAVDLSCIAQSEAWTGERDVRQVRSLDPRL